LFLKHGGERPQPSDDQSQNRLSAKKVLARAAQPGCPHEHHLWDRAALELLLKEQAPSSLGIRVNPFLVLAETLSANQAEPHRASVNSTLDVCLQGQTGGRILNMSDHLRFTL
jgi:hypothetical protein